MMRLKPWQKWPAGTVSVQSGLNLGALTALVEATVTVYSEQDPAAIERSPSLWRDWDWVKDDRVVGATVYVERGTSIDLSRWCTKATPGELDVICGAASNEEADWLPSYLTSLVYAVSATLKMSFDDPLRITAPVSTTRVLKEKREGFDSSPFNLDVRDKQSVLAPGITDALRQAIQPYVAGQVWGEHVRVLSSAIRRFMIAESRTNPVDRYLDYWLTCEFLTSHIRKGYLPSKIAESLAPHMNKPTSAGKRAVENALRLALLFDRRGEILHGSRDDVPPEDLTILVQIATELVRKEVHMPYAHNKVLEDALTAYASAKTSDRLA
jgi:hypothetical protein